MNDILEYLKLMIKLFNDNPTIYDNNIVIAIIAINMTVIGLTSLAETKTIIGIDYGKFLIKKFKFLGLFRIYHLLIGFALINGSSLLLIFVANDLFKVIEFLILVLSLIFAIFYFFGFILIENKWVKQQIYELELLGLYCHSNDTEHFKIDKLVGMNSGTRTSRKLSSNVIDYFDTFNADTQKSFEEVFGPKSLIYDESKHLSRKRKKLFNTERYRYRISNSGIPEISFEFFQLFRYSQLQDKWALDILRIMNGEPKDYDKYDIYRLYNLVRVLAQINVFGNSKNLFQYKFLENLRVYIYATTDITHLDKRYKKDKHLKEVEEFLIKEIFEYMTHTCTFYKDKHFIIMTQKVLKEMFIMGTYKGLLNKQELLELLLDKILEYNSDIMKELYVELINDYCNHPEKNKSSEIKMDRLINRIKEHYQTKQKSSMLTVEEFFRC